MELTEPIQALSEAKDNTMENCQEVVSTAAPAAVAADQVAEEENVNDKCAETESVSENPVASVEGESVGEGTERPRPLSKAELIEQAEVLSRLDAEAIHPEDVSRLKQQFYALHNVKPDDAADAEGVSSQAQDELQDSEEERFKELVNIIKEKKAAQRAAIDAQLEANLEAKRAIIASLVEMSSDADNVNKVFGDVRDMQARFKEIGEVPQQYSSEVWKQYQEAVERFYDQLKINKELRDYDFKKNLTEKEALVAEARHIQAEPDVIVAFKRLQELHNQWRTIGPVPKEVREQIWTSFKEVSTDINKRYQDFFVERKARERENEEAKRTICERVEALDFESLTTYAAWDAMTRQFIQAQEDWKKLGFASRKANNELYNRFRTVCDRFFTSKAAFFHRMKDVLAENLQRKIALCERAEALKDSTDWRATADELNRLQQEWKSIGAVAKKYSDQVWHRFLSACDHFFDQKKKNTSGTRRTERANLEEKREIIAAIAALEGEDSRDKAIGQLKDLQARWQSVGHVPFAEKDKVYDEYRATVNRIYGKWDTVRRGSRMESFESNLTGMGNDRTKLGRERERLLRAYETRKSELATYENNMGFLSARSKNADAMLREMQRHIQRLRDDLAELEAKVKAVDAKM